MVGVVWAQSSLEVLWAERDNPEKARAAISLLESELKANPHQPEKVVRLARLYYLVGEQPQPDEARLAWYDKAFQLGRAELAHQLGLPASVEDEVLVAKTTKAHLPLLYWAAAALARWSKHASFTQRVRTRSKLLLYWRRVEALDSAYFYGGAYRFFAGYHALVPAITGDRDVHKAHELFVQALRVAPNYLETKVLYAEIYAAHPDVQNRELFRRLLNEVLQAPVGTDPECLAENRLAKKKAQALLAREKELFD